MGTIARILFIVGMVLAVAGAAFGMAAPEGNFLARLESALRGQGMSQQEARSIADAAKSFDWSGSRRVDPKLIAEAIREVQAAGAGLTPQQSAEFGHGIAQAAAALENEGYSKSEVAQVTLAAVQSLYGQIQAWRDGEVEGTLGETVRRTVSDAVVPVASDRGVADPGGDAEGDETPAEGTPAGEVSPATPGRDAAR